MKLIRSVVVLAAPVDAGRDFRLLGKLYAFHYVLEELLIAGSVHDVSHVFLALKSVLVDILLDIRIAVLDDLKDALLVCPADEVLRETGILLACAAHNDDAEIVFFAPCPRAGRAIIDAYAAAYAEIGISHNLAVHKLQGAGGADLARR